MADEMPRADEVTNLTPDEVAAGLREGRMLLVDVRELNETAVGELSGGGRSCRCRPSIRPPFPIRRASRWCLPAGRAGARSRPRSRRRTPATPITHHMAGGIIAWKAAGLPTKT